VRLPPAPGKAVSRHAMLRVLLRIPPTAPRVLGTGDFALRRRRVCASVLTGRPGGLEDPPVRGGAVLLPRLEFMI
jgi:hypothetical protein